MAHKDYYQILGVSRTESARGIRTAFRQLAKTYHPDRAGPDTTRMFQDITEAYCVLSNPKTRECYNMSLLAAEDGVSLRVKTATSHSPRQPRVRPPRAFPWRSKDWEARMRADLFSELGLSTSATIGRSRRQFSKPLEVEVYLTQQEADQGGILPLPLTIPCSFCWGSGEMGFFPCPHCHGQGKAEAATIHLELPPALIHGTVLDYPLRARYPGIDLLRLHIALYP